MYMFEYHPYGINYPDVPGELPDFVKNVEEALRRGEIPADADNRERVRGLAEKWRQLEGLLETGKASTDSPEHWELARELDYFPRRSLLGPELSLRPEATASVCRAYLEHGMQSLSQPVKLYYMGPMFRRERPQKGRYRQFYQIGAEVLGGSDAPAIDTEVLEMPMAHFHQLGLPRPTLSL